MRIACKTMNCKGSILPTTAQETGGFCMPCVQGKAHKEWQDYIKANKKKVDLFENVFDPVDIIKIYHKKRQSDPLIEYVPYAQPIHQVYLKLTDKQISKLITEVLDFFKIGMLESATDITIALISFFNNDISAILEVFIDIEKYFPSFIFKDASPVIRDKLFDKLYKANDNGKIDKILSALAWIGDDEVINFFSKIDQETAAQYTLRAGWELDQDYGKRLLYFKNCYSLVDGTNQSANYLNSAFRPEKEICQSCSGKLISFLKLDLSASYLNFININTTHLNIGTCLKCCSSWSDGKFFTELSHDGHISWSHFNKKPINQAKEFDSWCVPDTVFLKVSSEIRSPYYGLFWGWSAGLQVKLSQIGGFPTWIQDDHYPTCPSCRKTMVFVAQIDTEDYFEYSEGTYYFFICSPCMLTTTVYQQT